MVPAGLTLELLPHLFHPRTGSGLFGFSHLIFFDYLSTQVAQLSKVFPDESDHFSRWARSGTGAFRSVKDLMDELGCTPKKDRVELLSMHFCFLFKPEVDKYDCVWEEQPELVERKLKQLFKEFQMYCPVSILLPMVYDELL